MLEEFSIQQTLNCYSEGASRADWPQVLSTFVPDGIWHIPALEAKFEGHNAIQEGLTLFSEPTDYIVQQNSPAVIKVEGDKATARSVIRECGKYSGLDQTLEVLGFYADDLVKVDGEWKFVQRVFELQGMHNYPILPPA